MGRQEEHLQQVPTGVDRGLAGPSVLNGREKNFSANVANPKKYILVVECGLAHLRVLNSIGKAGRQDGFRLNGAW